MKSYTVIIIFAILALLFFVNTSSPYSPPDEEDEEYEEDEMDEGYVSMYEPEEYEEDGMEVEYVSRYEPEEYDEDGMEVEYVSRYEPEEYDEEYVSMYASSPTRGPIMSSGATLMPMKDSKTYSIIPAGPKSCTMDGAHSKDMKGMGSDCCSKNGIDEMRNCKPGTMYGPSKLKVAPTRPPCPATCECPADITGYNLI